MAAPRKSLPVVRTMLAAGLLLLAVADAARAAEPLCPENAIKIVAPFPPGGPTDISARLLGDRLREQFGQTVIVEPRPGASGSIGTGYVAQQPGNGCTILLSYDTHGVNPALYPLPFDTVKAFRPVMLIGKLPNAIAVHASQPYKSLGFCRGVIRQELQSNKSVQG